MHTDPINPEDFTALIEGMNYALGFLIITIAKHPGIDTQLFLSDWQEMTEKVKKQAPQTKPASLALLKQFETMIKNEVRPNSF